MIKLKKFFIFFTICHLLFLQVSVVSPEVHSRIVGGTAISIDKRPYLVQLLDNGEFFCGGTLVSELFVVTAAHCIQNIPITQLTVVAGATTLREHGVRSGVAKIMIPKGFNLKAEMTVDVAVLKLSSPLTGRRIRPIGLCNKSWKPGAIVEVSGWGLIHEDAEGANNELQTAKVKVISKDKCVELYRGEAVLTNTMFCAAIPGSKDSCLGDSGGPAIINGQFCGIVSFGIGCGNKKFPGVYTNVLTVKKFIRNAMNR